MIIDVVKVFVPAILAFAVGILITPLITHYLYHFKAWKKKGGKTAMDGKEATEFNRLHADREVHTPRMGGIVIWASVLITVGLLFVADLVLPFTTTSKLDFLSRGQTWLPLFMLMVGAVVGLINDIRDVTTVDARGISLRTRLVVVALASGFAGWWFYAKLGVTAVGIPFMAPVMIGVLVIPLFMLVTLFIYASGVIDGIDGLAGGVFATIFAAYAGVAFFQNQIDLAALSAAISGATLAFLWFNIPPARFWMTETGTMGLTLALATIAFMTDLKGTGRGLIALPIIAAPLVVTVLANILQILSKKLLKKKIFRIAPLHHHFEAIGWPSYKVVMRYWVLSVICALAGVALALVG